MIHCRSPLAERLSASRPLLAAVILIGFLLVLVSAVRFQAPELLGIHKVMTDFDTFHIAGRLAAEGRVSDAYHMDTMLRAQQEMTGTRSFMPWTYPPPFTLLMQGVAMLPIGPSFVLFVLTSFAFYLSVLRRVAGQWLPGVVVALTPVIILNLRTGQNGFLIAGLIGAFLVTFRDNRLIAGLPLGLLVIKPHLAIGVGLLVLLHRRWSVLFLAGAVALGLLAIATSVFGLGIWADFRLAVTEAGGFLAAGYYPLFRMNSFYAMAYSLGATPAVAMALQTVSVLTALAALSYAYSKGIDYNRLAAVTCAASLCISPYGYDYDLTILGVGLAFIIPEILERSTTRMFLSLLGLAWLACGYGIAWTVAAGWGRPDTGVTLDPDNAGISLIGATLWPLFWLTYRVCLSAKPRSLQGKRTVGNIQVKEQHI